MIFVDTGAWVAIEDKRDINHQKALRIRDEIVASKIRLITTNYILDETYTLMFLNVGYNKTINFKNKLEQIIKNNILILYHVTPEIEQSAWQIFENFNKERSWSFTDCTSKAVMDKLKWALTKINNKLTFPYLVQLYIY